MEAKQYVIEKPSDFLAVPADRRDAMLADLRGWIALMGNLQEQGLFEQGIVSIGNFIWVDDGKPGCSSLQIRLQTKDAA